MDVKTFTDMISDANIILLGKPSLKYFGILAYGVEKCFYTKESSIFDVLPDYCKNALAWTNGKTMSFVARDEVTVEELNFDILHELSHIIMGHIRRMGSKDPEMWVLATDHVVNRNIMLIAANASKTPDYYDDTNLKEIMGETGNRIYIPEDIVFLSDVHIQFPEATAEQVYYLLEEANKSAQASQQNQTKDMEEEGDSSPSSGGEGEGECSPNSSDWRQSGTNDGGGQGENSDGRGISSGPLSLDGRFTFNSETIKLGDKECVVHSVKDNKTGDTYTFANDTSVCESDDISECEEIEERAKSLWYSKNQVFSKGNYPGGFVSYMDEIFKIEIPWSTLCESAILYPVQASRGRTWSVPNFYYRRFARVPGKRQKSCKNKLFVVLIDSSGSISNDNLHTFTGIVLDSIKYFDGLVILVHDVKVQQEFYFEKKPNEEKVFEDIREIKGRGGTSHDPVFKRVQQLYDDQDMISIVMSLTDYESNVQYVHKKYSWIFNTPMIWAVTSKSKVVLPNTEFKQIYIPPDLKTLGKLK